MKHSLSSLGLQEPLSLLAGAIKVFQLWANAALAWMYCCISQAWISDAPQLLFCSGYCTQLCTWFSQYSQCWQLSADLTLFNLAVECLLIHLTSLALTWMAMKFVLKNEVIHVYHNLDITKQGKKLKTDRQHPCIIGWCNFTCFDFGLWILWSALALKQWLRAVQIHLTGLDMTLKVIKDSAVMFH